MENITPKIDHDDDDEDITLSSDTLEILSNFLKQREAKENLETASGYDVNTLDFNFEENWQLSQFWYDEATRNTLGAVCHQLINEIIHHKTNGGQQKDVDIKIGLFSCPSLYPNIKNIANNNVYLFEYDKRFALFKDDFIHFDYNLADIKMYLKEFNDYFDIIICDPPFLSEECVEKMSYLIKRFKKPNAFIIFCSGETIAKWIDKHLLLFKCNYRPKHQRCLGNEFVTYANFNLDKYIK